MVSIKCEELRKEFSVARGSVVAVDSIDLTVEDGEFVTLVGPSGCGKTTLLRSIAGLETPTSGDIFFDDRRINHVRPQDRHLSMVFQNIALYPFKTVRENIEYGLKYSDEKSIDSDEVEQMAKMLNIEEQMDQKPGQLSGGQQQRVALARALIRDPDAFLLDEPMSDLDAQLKNQLRSEIKELQQRFQTTTIYVTHDQEEAMTLSDQVVVMNDGNIHQKSEPHVVYQRPNNLFVAEFIGSPTINTYSATVQDGKLVTSVFSVDLPPAARDELVNSGTSDEFVLGIRPQAFGSVDSSEAADTGLVTVPATVRLNEQMGDEIVVHLDKDGHEIRAVLQTTIPPEIGTELTLQINPEDMFVFDAESGTTILYGIAE